MIKFSVLLSVYKKENPEYLRESLSSIFSQTLQADEIVLVEDGSLTPALDCVISEFSNRCKNLKLVKLPINGGLGRALNEGMKECSYDYIVRMDTDDICFPNRFERQIDFISKHPEVDVLGCWTQEFMTDKEGNKVMLSLKKFPHNVWDNFNYCTKRCPVEHPAVVLKKSTVLAAGGYQHCYLFEDYHLWARMFVRGAIFYNLQEPLLYFRTSDVAMKRRGGWKYALSEVLALNEFHRIGFLSRNQQIYAMVTRFPVRIMPNRVRKMIYNAFLRK